MEFVYQMLAQGFDRLLSGDATTWATVWRTILVSLVSTAIALVPGLPLACWLAERRTRGQRVGMTLANAGLGLPPVVLGIFLALLLIPTGPLAFLGWDSTIQGVALAQVLLAFPIVVALVAAAVVALPPGLLEQARAFGAPWPRRAALALREARVGVLAAVIAALGSAFAEVGAVVIVGGNISGRTNTLASTVLLALNASDPAGATAQVIVLLALLAIMGAVLTLVQQRHR